MTNRISKVKDFVDHNAVKNNISNITNNDIRQTEFLFDYSLLTIENEDKDKLRKHEKSLLFHRKQINKATADMGRVLTEARDVFIKSHSESFVGWYEKLGFNKDQVSIAMNRYRIALEYPGEKEKVIDFSDRMIIQLSKKDTPKEVLEKALKGELKTSKDIVNEIKNNSSTLEKFSEIEEAEIIEKVSLDKFDSKEKIMLSSLNVVFEKIRTGSNTLENLKKLEKIQEILDGIR